MVRAALILFLAITADAALLQSRQVEGGIEITAEWPPDCSHFEYSRTLNESEWYPYKQVINFVRGKPTRVITMVIDADEDRLWLRLTDCAGITTENEQPQATSAEISEILFPVALFPVR